MEEKMINSKYQKIYEEFLKNYEQIHVNPWHEIDKQELERIVNDLLQRYDVTGGYSFCYFINYIIRISPLIISTNIMTIITTSIIY